MDEIAKVLFGAAIGFIAALLGEAIKRRRASQVAAMMVVRELDFHQQRLDLAVAADKHPDATYTLMLPAPIWTAQSVVLLAGTKASDSEALLNWYATLFVLGNQISKQLGPGGVVLGGPERSRMVDALTEARNAALRVASRSLLWSYRSNQQSLFTSVTEQASAKLEPFRGQE